MESTGEAKPPPANAVSELITPLDAACAADVVRFGGKAANLGELCRAGLPVPRGYVISTEACRQFFAHTGILSDVTAARDARSRIASIPIPAELEDEILCFHRAFFEDDARVAVRSSATTEDLAGASFAGQHATYYHVTSATLSKFVRDCWMSLFHDCAVAYRDAMGVAELPLMAVIVQQLVPASVSGVTFTNDPMGDDTVLVIESAWGMGAAIVDGRVTPDRYRVQRADLEIRDRRISDKRFMVTCERQLPRLRPVPADDRLRPTLTDAVARRVATIALQCESLLGAPQDVEWAIAGEEIHLLQSRPVTTPAPVSAAVPGRWVLFKPLAENFTEPLTPLTVDLMSRFNIPFIRFVNGWVYINLDVVRACMPIRLSDEELIEATLLRGLPENPRVRWSYLPVWLVMAATYYLLLGVFLARTRRLPADIMSRFRERVQAALEDPRLDAHGAVAGLVAVPGFLTPVGDLPLQINIMSGRHFFLMPVLRALLRHWCPGLPADAFELLTGGMQDVASTEMSAAIRDLADQARNDETVRAVFEQASAESVHDELRRTDATADFLESLDGFLNVHGHRAIKEFDLSTPRWREDPTAVLGMVRNLLERGELPELDKHRQPRELLRHTLANRLRGFRWWLVRYLVERIRYFTRLRENSRFYHSMIMDLARSKVLDQETALLAAGRLRCRDDIFFLGLEEIDALADGRLEFEDVEPRIRQRRQEHTRRSRTGAPLLLGLATAHGDDADDDARLAGYGASPGVAEGCARVILDPVSQGALQPGEILVAPYTDPAWTPLFMSAAAAVVEVGSYLSHAGTVAREFGLPCVVDAAGCTLRIRTGDRLRVDGTSGAVWILERGP